MAKDWVFRHIAPRLRVWLWDLTYDVDPEEPLQLSSKSVSRRDYQK
jgi:hypothetical protein